MAIHPTAFTHPTVQTAINAVRHLPIDDQVGKLTELLTPFYNNDPDEAEYFAKLIADLGMLD